MGDLASNIHHFIVIKLLFLWNIHKINLEDQTMPMHWFPFQWLSYVTNRFCVVRHKFVASKLKLSRFIQSAKLGQYAMCWCWETSGKTVLESIYYITF